MTGISIDSSSGLGDNSTLTNQGVNGTLQLTGLNSGINTTQLIDAEMEVIEEPLNNLENEESGTNGQSEVLTSIQADLQEVALDAQQLGSPAIFVNQQTVSSSGSSAVTAESTAGEGAVIGTSEVTVSQLATAAQRTFNVNLTDGKTASSDTLTISNNGATGTLTIAAGSTVDEIAADINNSSTLPVFAAVNSDGQLVLSARSTGLNDATSSGGQTSANTFISVTDGSTQVSGFGLDGSGNNLEPTDAASGTLLSEDTSAAQDGLDATYTVNGTVGHSATDTVVDGLPGVTLNLLGVTGSTPVSLTTGNPTPSSSVIISAVEEFVNDYNTALSAIMSAVDTAPASESNPGDFNPDSGSLFGDTDLEDMLVQLRTAVGSTVAGSDTASGLTTLASIGISTGAPSGTVSTSSVDGFLTINTGELDSAVDSDPTAVQQLLTSFSTSFQPIVNDFASPTGTIETRIEGNSETISNLQVQISSQQQLDDQQEETLEKEWASVETTLANLNDQKQNLTAFSNAIGTSTSTTTSTTSL
jgi:flagellar hook-associated protein 2